MDTPILIVDDDRELCALLGEYLALQGFRVDCEHDGAAALARLAGHRYAAIVLDIMLPGMQGLDVLRNLRRSDDTPVLMLTARGEDTDRIVGLELGADDYLPKPCNPRELAARLRAVLRRSAAGGDDHAPLAIGHTTLDPGAREARHAGKPLPLTSAEFRLLQALLSRAGAPVDKERLSREALGRPLAALDRSVDVHISKLRRKLADAGGDGLIVSIRGQGYQFTLPREP